MTVTLHCLADVCLIPVSIEIRKQNEIWKTLGIGERYRPIGIILIEIESFLSTFNLTFQSSIQPISHRSNLHHLIKLVNYQTPNPSCLLSRLFPSDLTSFLSHLVPFTNLRLELPRHLSPMKWPRSLGLHQPLTFTPSSTARELQSRDHGTKSWTWLVKCTSCCTPNTVWWEFSLIFVWELVPTRCRRLRTRLTSCSVSWQVVRGRED